MSNSSSKSVADPGFPSGWVPTPNVGVKAIIWAFFPENCMKMKEIGPRGGRGLLASLVPPM